MAVAVVGRRPSRPWLVSQQLPYLRRAVRWPPIVSLSAVAALLTRSSLPPALIIATVAAGLAYVLDDPAAVILDATPHGRGRRRVVRLGLTLPVAAILWFGVVQPLWSMRSGAPAAAAADLAVAALAAVVLAASSVGGGVAGMPVAMAVALLGSQTPAGWDLPVTSGGARNWTIVLAVGVAILVLASRDPAAGHVRVRAK